MSCYVTLFETPSFRTPSGMSSTSFSQRKAGICAALAAQVNDKSPKGSLDAPIADLVNEINQHALFYTTSSCSGRITLFLDAQASKQSKGGEWLLISHDRVDWEQLYTAAYDTFPARVSERAATGVVSGALTLRFEPFILAVECSTLDAATRLLRVAAASGFRESGLSAVDKRFLVSVRCSIRLEVPLWDSRASTDAKILVDQDYVRFLLESANRKFAANELRICNFHRAFRTEFFDASTLRTLPPIGIAGVVDATDDFSADDRLHESSQTVKNGSIANLIVSPSAAALTAELLSQCHIAPSAENVWAVVAPIKFGRPLQDAIRARDFRVLSLKPAMLPVDNPTHIVIALNEAAQRLIGQAESSVFQALFAEPSDGAKTFKPSRAAKRAAKEPSQSEERAVKPVLTPTVEDLHLSQWPMATFQARAQQSQNKSSDESDKPHASHAPLSGSIADILAEVALHQTPTASAVLPANASPYARLSVAVREFVAPHLQRVADRLSVTAADAETQIMAAVPKKWEILGDTALLSPKSFRGPAWSILFESSFDAVSFWALVAGALRVARLGRQDEIHPGGTRRSQVLLLHPPNCADGWVKHRENGVIYCLDVTKVMFSSGNGTEKQRLIHNLQSRASRVAEQLQSSSLQGSPSDLQAETFLDLYTGIGYFSVPALVHTDIAHAHMCEWNPDAVEALRKNLEVNQIDPTRCSVYPGDNRLLELKNSVDRISLGLIPRSEDGWPVALQALKPEGGMLHIHENVASADRVKWVEEQLLPTLQSLARQWPDPVKRKFQFEVIHIETVKNYAPHVVHIVVDVLVTSPTMSPLRRYGFVGATTQQQPNNTNVVSSTHPFRSLHALMSTPTEAYRHRQPVPVVRVRGTQSIAGENVHAWVDSGADFWSHWYAQRRPLLLRGIDVGPAPQTWTSDRLIELAQLQPRQVAVHVCTGDRMDFTDRNYVFKSMPLHELFERASGHARAEQLQPRFLDNPHERYYLRSLGDNVRNDVADFPTQFPHMAKDLHLPADWAPPRDRAFCSALRCSSAGCRLWTHYDISDNFLVHVGPGTKRVILFAPTDSPCLYAATTSSSVLDLDQPDLQRYPHFAHARPLECILQPGDVLFIPALWWHNVETISFCTSVNFFWHAEPEHWYDQTDVYGSKDLRLAQHALAAAHACKTALNALPSSYYVDFYRIRAMEVIEAATCVSEQSSDFEATTARALDVDHDHA